MQRHQLLSYKVLALTIMIGLIKKMNSEITQIFVTMFLITDLLSTFGYPENNKNRHNTSYLSRSENLYNKSTELMNNHKNNGGLDATLMNISNSSQNWSGTLDQHNLTGLNDILPHEPNNNTFKPPEPGSSPIPILSHQRGSSSYHGTKIDKHKVRKHLINKPSHNKKLKPILGYKPISSRYFLTKKDTKEYSVNMKNFPNSLIKSRHNRRSSGTEPKINPSKPNETDHKLYSYQRTQIDQTQSRGSREAINLDTCRRLLPQEKTINIAVLVPTNASEQYKFKRVMPAVKLGVKHLKETGLRGPLESWNIEVRHRDTQCSSTHGPLAAVDLHFNLTAGKY